LIFSFIGSQSAKTDQPNEKGCYHIADTIRMGAFIFGQNVVPEPGQTREQTFTVELEDDDIITACTEYDGHLNMELTLKKPRC
jgi:hypothetical protein